MASNPGRSIHDSQTRFFSRKGAKAQRRTMNAKTYFAPLRLCGRTFLLTLVITASVHSQSTSDLTNLEESVRYQITAAQAALTSLKKDPATTQTALSEG